MKKVVFLLLLLASSNSYTQNSDSGIDICIALKGFNSSSEADDALNRILSTIGVSKNFVMQECSNVSNASALQVEGVRYIFYNQQWMMNVNNKTSYGGLFTLAHEVGHHINGHALDWVLYATESVNSKTLSERRKQELEADEFAGFVLAKLGASLNETTAVIRGSVDNSDDTYSTHPSLDKRLASIKKGYLNGSGGTDTSNYYNTTTTTNDIIFYNDGSRWEGAIKPSEQYTKVNEQGHVGLVTTSKKAHGYGIMYETDGSVFKGVFYNGSANGYGEKYYTDGSTYKGQYVNGRYAGKGIIVKPLGSTGICYGGYTDDEDRGICWSNFTFEGFFKDGYPSGKGVLIENNNGNKTIYEGQWDKWILNGFGKITFSDGEIWEGNLFEVSLEGYGTKTLPNGKVITGVWGTESFYEKAESQYENRNYKAAIINYTKAIDMDPNDFFAFEKRGLAKYYLDDNAGAISDFTKAIAINPMERIYVKNRGDSKFNLKDYLGAINDYDKAIEIEPGNIQSYHQRGRAKFALKDYTSAIKDFKKSIDLGLNKDYVFSNIARSYYELQNYQEAKVNSTKAIELDPNNAMNYFLRAWHNYKLGDSSNACRDIKKAIELSPDDYNIDDEIYKLVCN